MTPMGMSAGLQRERFLAAEGDAWFRRNRQALSLPDRDCPVLRMVAKIDPCPSRVLEIGCANGWRLNKILNCGAHECVGIDPSRAAIEDGGCAFPSLQLHVGTAERFPSDIGNFDLVIFGFCLYLCDPGDHFQIIAQADKALADRGHLIIYDFDPTMSYRNEYSHAPAMFSYKMDYPGLFLAHPHYSLRERHTFSHQGGDPLPDNRVAVSLLAKDTRLAWPPNPLRDARS
jgi:SAM-dependent methyltransferase